MCNEFMDKVAQWEDEEKGIKRQTIKWIRLKKPIDDKLKADKETVDVLEWLIHEDNPEPTLDAVKQRVMLDKRYEQTGQWFVDRIEMITWCETFEPSNNQVLSKRTF